MVVFIQLYLEVYNYFLFSSTNRQKNELKWRESDNESSLSSHEPPIALNYEDNSKGDEQLEKHTSMESFAERRSSFTSDFRMSDYRPSDYSEVDMISDVDELETVDEGEEEPCVEGIEGKGSGVGIAMTGSFFEDDAENHSHTIHEPEEDHNNCAGDVSFDISALSEEEFIPKLNLDGSSHKNNASNQSFESSSSIQERVIDRSTSRQTVHGEESDSVNNHNGHEHTRDVIRDSTAVRRNSEALVDESCNFDVPKSHLASISDPPSHLVSADSVPNNISIHSNSSSSTFPDVNSDLHSVPTHIPTDLIELSDPFEQTGEGKDLIPENSSANSKLSSLEVTCSVPSNDTAGHDGSSLCINTAEQKTTNISDASNENSAKHFADRSFSTESTGSAPAFRKDFEKNSKETPIVKPKTIWNSSESNDLEVSKSSPSATNLPSLSFSIDKTNEHDIIVPSKSGSQENLFAAKGMVAVDQTTSSPVAEHKPAISIDADPHELPMNGSRFCEGAAPIDSPSSSSVNSLTRKARRKTTQENNQVPSLEDAARAALQSFNNDFPSKQDILDGQPSPGNNFEKSKSAFDEEKNGQESTSAHRKGSVVGLFSPANELWTDKKYISKDADAADAFLDNSTNASRLDDQDDCLSVCSATGSVKSRVDSLSKKALQGTVISNGSGGASRSFRKDSMTQKQQTNILLSIPTVGSQAPNEAGYHTSPISISTAESTAVEEPSEGYSQLKSISTDSNMDIANKFNISVSEKNTPTNLITVGGDMHTYYDDFQQKFIHLSAANTPLTPMGAPRFAVVGDKKTNEAILSPTISASEVVARKDAGSNDFQDKFNPRNLTDDIGTASAAIPGNEAELNNDTPQQLQQASSSNATKETKRKNSITSPGLCPPNSWIKKKDDRENSSPFPPQKARMEPTQDNLSAATLDPIKGKVSTAESSPGKSSPARRRWLRGKRQSPASDSESDEANKDSNIAIVSDPELTNTVGEKGGTRQDSVIASVRPPNALKKRLHGSAGQVQSRKKSYDNIEQPHDALLGEFYTHLEKAENSSNDLAAEPRLRYAEIYNNEVKNEVIISPMLKSGKRDEATEENKVNESPSNVDDIPSILSNDTDNASNKENAVVTADSKSPSRQSNLSDEQKLEGNRDSKHMVEKRKRGSTTSADIKKGVRKLEKDSEDELSEAELANKPTIAEKSNYIVVPTRKQQSQSTTTLLDLSNEGISNCVDFSQFLDSGSFKNLKILLLRNNELDSVDELSLGEQFANLTDLDLAYNFISSPVSQYSFPKTLLRLDLSHNKLVEISSIMVCIGLLELNLSHNRIKIVTGLPSTLRRLDLSYNRIASSLSLRLLSLSPDIQTMNIAGNPILKKDPQWRLKLRSFLPKLAIIDATVINKTLATKMQEQEEKAKMKKPVIDKEWQANNDMKRVQQHQKRLEKLAQLANKVDQEAKIVANHHKPMHPEEVSMLTDRLSKLSPSKMKKPPAQQGILKPSIHVFHQSSSPIRQSAPVGEISKSQHSKPVTAVSKKPVVPTPTILRYVMPNKEPKSFSPLRKKRADDIVTRNPSESKLNVNQDSYQSGNRSLTSSFPDFSIMKNRKLKNDEFKYNIREDDEHFLPSSSVNISTSVIPDLYVAIPLKETDMSTDKNQPQKIESSSVNVKRESKAKRFLTYDSRRIVNEKNDLSLNDFADLSLSSAKSAESFFPTGSYVIPTSLSEEDIRAEQSGLAESGLAAASKELLPIPQAAASADATEPVIERGLVASAVNRIIKRSLSSGSIVPKPVSKSPSAIGRITSSDDLSNSHSSTPSTVNVGPAGKLNVDSLSQKLKLIEDMAANPLTIPNSSAFSAKKKESRSRSKSAEGRYSAD